MNEVLRVIERRYSCRDYEDRLPEAGLLETIAKAAVQSPSALNKQPWQLRVIADQELLAEMDAEGMAILSAADDQSTYQRFMERGGRLFYHAPCMFLILKQAGTDLDCGIVSQNISLAATSLGLDSVICGMAAIPFKGAKATLFKQRVQMSSEWEFGMAVLVGYGKGQGTPHQPDLSKIEYIGELEV